MSPLQVVGLCLPCLSALFFSSLIMLFGPPQLWRVLVPRRRDDMAGMSARFRRVNKVIRTTEK